MYRINIILFLAQSIRVTTPSKIDLKDVRRIPLSLFKRTSNVDSC